MLATTDLIYRYGPDTVDLSMPALAVRAGRTLALVGPSGCGKSTLLSLLSGERVPSSGSVRFGDASIEAMSDAERRRFRITTVGLIFQDFRLVEYLSVLDNILLPCRLHSALPLNVAARRRAEELAERLGIAALARRLPERLSHGERQRVAVARGLLARPRLLLADEPTGNLDPAGKKRLLDELLALARDDHASVIVATHDHGLLPAFDAVYDFAARSVL
ncbi:MAG: ATP-binding cassette domain-containing protein [Phycisphaerae bacterium]|nr:ATP-binding cassette domain-containing protein [Phycisphaerae bacterium]